jgi:hypothetical protein
METYKETFLKFVRRLDEDMSKMESKSLDEIKDLKSLYKSIADIESKIKFKYSTFGFLY